MLKIKPLAVKATTPGSSVPVLVSLAAVFSVVTQRSSPQTAVCGEERCVTTLKTAARETIPVRDHLQFNWGSFAVQDHSRSCMGSFADPYPPFWGSLLSDV